MEAIQNFLKTQYKEVSIAALCIVGAVLVIKRLKKREKKNYPPNTIIHHQVGRGPYAPSQSPFAVKLETYLRMAKVPFMNEHDSETNRSSKDKNFSGEEIAAGRAIQRMVDEHLYWTLALQRWVFDPKNGIDSGRKRLGVPWLVFLLVRNNIKKQTYAQGVGRHTEKEVMQVMEEDLQTLSKLLGKKKYILGEHASQTDCSVFAILSQIHWQDFGGAAKKVYKKYPNLSAYTERMKEEFWPDWDDCITRGGTRKAPK
uniref:Metaxin glutathione S-transferase domain-containing protein n=1 Tax=Magallana gigas TaxID=29159 RepID=A0A8W8L0C6_MAGGI